MRVLVTGATGFIGLALLDRLPERHDAVAFVRDRSRTELLPNSVETVLGDVTDADSVQNAVEEVDSVAHLAGVNPGSTNDESVVDDVSRETFEAVNVEGTHNVVKACRRSNIDSLVYTSTTNAHPDVSYDYESLYVDTKREGGNIVSSSGLNYSIVHPTYVMGSRDYRLKRYREFRLAAGNLLLVPPLYTPGKINIIHVDTVADSIIYYLEQPTNNRHILSGQNIDRLTFARQLASLSDRPSLALPMPLHSVLLPWVVRAVDRIGLANLDPKSLSLNEQTAVIPEIHEDRSPVKGKSWRDAVKDTYEWYEQMRLL